MIEGDTFISQRHARIYIRDGQPMVEDLGWTNGSFHNGNRLSGARLLHPGDHVQVGFSSSPGARGAVTMAPGPRFSEMRATRRQPRSG